MIVKRFEGKMVLVTGAGSGIGMACALRFAEEGANVVVNDINAESANKVVSEIESKGSQAIAVIADVTKSDQVESMVKIALDKFGKIDILVNNVGGCTWTAFTEISEEEFDRIMNINLKTTFLCCKKVVPHMIKKRYGKIINVSSVAAKHGAGGPCVHYIAAKHAVVGLTRALALELIPYNIYVNAVCPGSTETLMKERYIRAKAKATGRKYEDLLKEMMARNPLHRDAKPEEQAALIAFLASDEASYMLGQPINNSPTITW